MVQLIKHLAMNKKQNKSVCDFVLDTVIMYVKKWPG